MAGSVNKVILVGNVGNDPEIRSFNMAARSPISRSRHQRIGAISNRASAKRKPNGTASLFSVTGSSMLLSVMSKRAASFISKASFKPANGKTVTAMINIPLRSLSKASAEPSPCSTAVMTARVAAAGEAAAITKIASLMAIKASPDQPQPKKAQLRTLTSMMRFRFKSYLRNICKLFKRNSLKFLLY